MINRKQFTNSLKKKDIILFGAGNFARQFYRDFHEILNIQYCISNNSREEVFIVDDKEICPVKRANSVVLREKQLIIICAESYREMELQLRDMGYHNGIHYINSSMTRVLLSDKKIAIFYGVCYMRALYSCLIESEKFRKEYEAIYWLDYRRMDPEEYELYSFLLPMCDLFIYTVSISFDKSQRNQAYLSRLSKECRTVKIPFITFTGYHPRTEGEVGELNAYDVTSNKTYFGTFMIPDCNINRMIGEGKSCNEIVKIVSDTDFYNKAWLEDNFNKGITMLKLADRLADIKIVDFLLLHHGKERLFLNETHINNFVVIELAGRILDFIGMNRDLPEDELMERRLLYTTEMPIYPSVIQHLGLKIYEGSPKYRLFTFEDEIDVSFEEYVEQYYAFCSSMKKWMAKGYFPK